MHLKLGGYKNKVTENALKGVFFIWHGYCVIALQEKEVIFMNNLKCEKCGSESVLNHLNYCECIECGNRFLNDLGFWINFYKY